MKQKKLSWLIGAMFALPVASSWAAEAAAADVQQVTVTGIRASVRNALLAKEAAAGMVEVIASEDIGKLPDVTIAESLARLPGLSSGLDRGNASQVVARGMGPRFIGATLNGRELASSEPGRAVRFEQFPSESLSGATVYKTQSAELVEGGIATSIDLQTVQPLKYRERQVSLKADALYYELGRDIPGSTKLAPRLGGVYIDQFAQNTLGVALAFSYQDQPSLVKHSKHWGFNEDHSADINGDGKVDKTPWGFEDGFNRGKDKRSSVLAKVEWKADADTLLTGDVYYAKNSIREPGAQRWSSDVGNWDGANSANFSNLDIRDGYVVGGTARNVGMTSNSADWEQDNSALALGLNAKTRLGAWKLEGDLSSSNARRSSVWFDVRQPLLNNSTVSWNYADVGNQHFSYPIDTGNAANLGTATFYADSDARLKDDLNALHLNASREFADSVVKRVKFGARFSDREKSYSQVSWSQVAPGALPDSAYENVNLGGQDGFAVLRDFHAAAQAAFGGNVFDSAGRAPTQTDVLAGWKVKERSTALYAQADLDGMAAGKAYRGNAGVRVVHTSHTGYGAQVLDGVTSPVEGGASYTEVLPSVNLIVALDEEQEHQIRLGLARAMSRAPIDELRGSRNLSAANPLVPLTGSAGNPGLKPMLADQLDVAYQWYFGKASLLSTGLFYKKVRRYIGIASEETTIDGRAATITRSVNGGGGNVKGAELVYQQAFSGLPAPFDGLGIYSTYSYTDSDIMENNPTGKPFPLEGLIKNNAGVTLWYEKAGYEARVSYSHHSGFSRQPSWTGGAFVQNGAETYWSMNLAKQLTKQVQLRFGIDNLTNQKLFYTYNGNSHYQEASEFGRRFNLGLSFKL